MKRRKQLRVLSALSMLLAAVQTFSSASACLAARAHTPEPAPRSAEGPVLQTGQAVTTSGERPANPRTLIAGDQASVDLRMRPFQYWRMWANRPLPFVPAFLFCLLTSATAWLLLPGTLAAAQESCRTSFWRSLLTGAVTIVLAGVFARCLFRSQIGSPLAVLVLAALELGLLLGLAVSVALVGESVAARLRVAGHPWLSARPRVKSMLKLTVGGVLICLLLLIPGLGGLPRIGTRLVVLVAFLGLGGIIRAHLARRKPN